MLTVNTIHAGIKNVENINYYRMFKLIEFETIIKAVEKSYNGFWEKRRFDFEEWSREGRECQGMICFEESELIIFV